MTYQDITDNHGPRHDIKSTPTNKLLLAVVAFVFATTAVALLFSATSFNAGEAGTVVIRNSNSALSIALAGAYPEFELQAQVAARGYKSITGRLLPGDQVVILGQTELGQYIGFNNGGLVHTISLSNDIWGSTDCGIFNIEINARGPVGFGTGCGHLRFTRENGERETYTVCSSTTKIHTITWYVDYETHYPPPVIVKIDWSNWDFHD